MADIKKPQVERRAAYSVEETARILGIGRTSVFKVIKDGRLQSVKIRDRRMIRPEAIKAFLDDCATGGGRIWSGGVKTNAR